MKTTTGEIIANLRNKRGISQLALAESLHIGQSTLAMYEKGKRSPNLEMITKIADYFNVSTDYLLGRPEKADDDQVDLDLERALDNAHSFSGKPLSEHDRKVAKDVLRSLFQD